MSLLLVDLLKLNLKLFCKHFVHYSFHATGYSPCEYHRSINQSVNRSIDPSSIHPSTHPPIHPFIHQSIDRKNVGFFKTKSYAKNEIKSWSKDEFFNLNDRKHCWKRRKCWLPAFSPFPTMFSNATVVSVTRTRIVLLRVYKN